MTDKKLRKTLAVSAALLMLSGAVPASAGQLQLAGNTKAAGQTAGTSGGAAQTETETERKAHYMEALYNSNIRAKADSTSTIAGTVIKGDIIEVTGAEGNFLQVKKGNVVGYIRSDLLGETEKEAQTEKSTEEVKTAETQKQTELQTEKKTEVQIEKQSEMHTETQTEKQSEMHTEVQTREETESENSEQENTEASNEGSEKDSRPRRARKYREDAEKLPTRMKALKACNVRSQANTDSEVIASLEEGDEVEINGAEGDYYLIHKDELTGYVFYELLEDISEPQQDEIKEVTVLADCYLWTEADDRSEKVARVAAGTKLKVSEGEYGYLKTEVEGKEGYINQYLVK